MFIDNTIADPHSTGIAEVAWPGTFVESLASDSQSHRDNHRGNTMRLPILLMSAFLCAATASAQTSIRFSNDWKWEGPNAPMLLALDRGWYAEAGLDVAMDTGKGSREAIPRVADGSNWQLGSSDINSLIKFRDKNPDLAPTAVMMIYNAPPFAIIGRKSLGVMAPKDLEGKILGAPAPDGAYAQWKAFVKANGIDASRVTIENVGFPVREPMLAAGKVDAITGYSFSSFINLKAKGVGEEDISLILMRDHGLDLYGNALIVNPDFAKANPDAVKAFVAVTVRAYLEAAKDPESAVKHVLNHNDVAREEVELERLRMALAQNIITDEVRANGFGGVDMARLERSIDQIADTYEFTIRPVAADVFDSQYLPPKADRMVP